MPLGQTEAILRSWWISADSVFPVLHKMTIESRTRSPKADVNLQVQEGDLSLHQEAQKRSDKIVPRSPKSPDLVRARNFWRPRRTNYGSIPRSLDSPFYIQMSTHNNTEPEGEATYKSVVMAEKPIVPRKNRKIGGVGKGRREKFNQQHLHSVS